MPSDGGLTAGRVAHLVGGDLLGTAEQNIVGVAPLERAGPGDLSFLSTTRYVEAFRRSRAGVVLVPDALRDVNGGPAARIVVPDVHSALAALLPRLYPEPPAVWGVHATCRLGTNVRWSQRISIGPGAQLGDSVTLGSSCVIGANVSIGHGAQLGDDCHVEAGATIESGCRLGNGVIVRPGARIGTAGFGFVEQGAGYRAVQHIGTCIIGNAVEIGANATIDRGSISDTVVGEHTKIDNLVHLGHNVAVGKRCLIMAQVGVAGSSRIEDDVILAGQAGVADHLTVACGARVGAQAGVIGDVPQGTTVSGYPARSHRTVLLQAAALARMTPIINRLEQLVDGGCEPE